MKLIKFKLLFEEPFFCDVSVGDYEDVGDFSYYLELNGLFFEFNSDYIICKTRMKDIKISNKHIRDIIQKVIYSLREEKLNKLLNE